MGYRPSGITKNETQFITKTLILHKFYRDITKAMMEDFEDMIHIYMNENETKTDRGALDKVIE